MDFLPLTLGIRRESDAEGKAKLPPAQLRQQSKKTLDHDNFTCQFCGFRSTQYQRTIPWKVKGRELPLVTACTFCEQCLHLERAGAMGSGWLIWLPEISQRDLNHLVRAIYIARANKSKTPPAAAETDKDGPKASAKAPAKPDADKAGPKEPSREEPQHGDDMITAADRANAALLSRRSDAKRRLGSDDPMLLATILHESFDGPKFKQVASKLDGVRLLALEKYLVRGPQGDTNQFPKMLSFWQSEAGPYGKLPLEKWSELFRGAMAGDNAA